MGLCKRDGGFFNIRGKFPVYIPEYVVWVTALYLAMVRGVALWYVASKIWCMALSGPEVSRASSKGEFFMSLTPGTNSKKTPMSWQKKHLFIYPTESLRKSNGL